jgi:Ca2+-binding EF-hand superfamily protein
MKHAFKIAGLGLLLGTAVTLAAAPASARGPIGGGMAGPGGFGARGGLFATDFAELDVNGDGLITEEDLLARAEARFAEVDADGSGALDASELAAGAQARVEARMQNENRRPRGFDLETVGTRMAERMIEARDSDDDGVLSLAELGPDKGFGRVIDRFDTDDDNAISQAEFDAAKAEIGERHARGGGHGMRGGHGPQGGPGFGGKRH